MTLPQEIFSSKSEPTFEAVRQFKARMAKEHAAIDHITHLFVALTEEVAAARAQFYQAYDPALFQRWVSKRADLVALDRCSHEFISAAGGLKQDSFDDDDAETVRDALYRAAELLLQKLTVIEAEEIGWLNKLGLKRKSDHSSLSEFKDLAQAYSVAAGKLQQWLSGPQAQLRKPKWTEFRHLLEDCK
jgi:hypothetical protein